MLVCLQALDAGGKDGTIRHVMSGVNPQGVHVSSFKAPSAEELGHDYLWRHACRLPARGEIGIFNRSHYEEVLVVRVHPEILDREKLPEAAKGQGVWDRRYREINDWERYLTDNGFKLVKLMLNLWKEEQRARFLKRIDLPEKNWKFSAADARERRYWDDYTPRHHMTPRGPEPVRAWTPPCAQQGRITSGQGMRRFWWRIPRTLFGAVGISVGNPTTTRAGRDAARL